MLKQILRDMYVDPEILAELPEEQKQILFLKIREEQVRRYMEREKLIEKKGYKKEEDKRKRNTGVLQKKVRILEDSNSQPWTWVMGEHPNDTPVEEIWENLGNKDWKPPRRKENQQPVSKVQAIIFAQNKDKNRKPNGIKNQKGNLSSEDQPDGTRNLSNKVVQKPEDKPTPGPPIPANKPQITPPHQPKELIPAGQTATYSPPMPPKPATRTTLPKGSKSTAKPPVATARKSLADKEDADDSDSDPYENMAEVANALPSKELGDNEWERQLKRFKVADERRRINAKRASVLLKRQSRQNLMQEQKLHDLKAKFERRRSSRKLIRSSERPALPPKPTTLRPKHPAPKEGRGAKPTSREEVEQWFKETQTSEILESVDDGSSLPKWFHGMISRIEAESLLEKKNVGDFLLRVSDKIWGYALSYKDENKIKHFLIDASEANCYHFFGNDQIRHSGLEELIAFHQDEPISYGNEILKNEVGQTDPNKPDYTGLIEPIQIDAGVNKASNYTAF